MPILPIHISPYHSYLHEANTFSVLMAYPQLNGYIYSGFVQLRWTEGWLFSHMPHNIYTGMPCLQQEWVYRELLSDADFDIIAYIRHSIDHSMYVATYINEKYLPNVNGDLCSHNTLVYGYDDENRTIHLLGYDLKSHYGAVTCSYEEFRKAFDTCVFHPSSPFGRIIRFRVAEVETSHVDFVALSDEIRSFYRSESCDHQVSAVVNACYQTPAVWGMDCYEKIKEYFLENWKSRTYIDIRIPYAVWENKRFMLDRLRYFQRYRLVDELDEIISDYCVIERDAEYIKNLVHHYNLSLRKPSFDPVRYEQVFSKYNDKVVEIERALLPKLEEKLRNAGRNQHSLIHIPIDQVISSNCFSIHNSNTFRSGDWLRFDKVDMCDPYTPSDPGIKNVIINLCKCTGIGKINIRLHSLDGPTIACVNLSNRDSDTTVCSPCGYLIPEANQSRQYACALYFEAEGDESFSATIDSIMFESNFNEAIGNYAKPDIDKKNYAIACTKMSNAGYEFGKMGHYHVGHVKYGAWLQYQDFSFHRCANRIYFLAAVNNSDPCYIDIHIGSPASAPVGRCKLADTGDYFNFQVFSSDLQVIEGVHDLYFVLNGEKLNIDSFWFE